MSQDQDMHWEQSLAAGPPGMLMLAARDGHRTTSLALAKRMVTQPLVADPTACGLFQGAPAVAYALHAVGPAFSTTRDDLARAIARVTRRRIQAGHDRISQGLSPAMREYDLISGLTGLGVYWLTTRPGDPHLAQVLAYLVRLVTEAVRTADGDDVPGWWTRDSPSGRLAPDWPSGHGNLGLAHGLAGPLALLGLAARCGVLVPGQLDAIAAACRVFDEWQQDPGGRAWWPGIVTPAEWRRGTVSQKGPDRPSWCYGTPGIVRAQQLAALALGDKARQQVAEATVAACVADPLQLALLTDGGLCHGWAGLLHTARRIAADAIDPEPLQEQIPDLEHRLRHAQRPTAPGLLEGTTGIDLVRRYPDTAWDGCLLIG